MILRMFISAIAPGDADEFRRIFKQDVVPAFTAHEECLGIELLVSPDPGVDGLLEGAAVSRWRSVEGMEKALASSVLQDAQVRIRSLLRRRPIRKIYEVVD